MKLEIKVSLYMLGIIVTIFLSILLGSSFYIPKVPAPAPFGFAVIVIIFGFDCLVEICRGKTNQTISNVGHWSINASKDIHFYSWHNPLVKKDDDKKIGKTCIMFPGGVDYYGISIKSNSGCPVWIFPSKYLEKEENNYHVNANLYRKELNEISPSLRAILLKHFPSRIKSGTKIFFGGTSHLDGSDTLENLKLEFEKASENKEYNSLDTRLDNIYKELERSEEHKKKKLIIGREVKPVDDDVE